MLFCWLFVGWDDELAAARRFLGRLLEGYRRHAKLAPDWLEGVDRILKVREADIHLLIRLDDEEWDGPEWTWMTGRRERVFDRVLLLGRPLADVM